MTSPKRSRRQPHAIGKKGRRSLGAAILARTLADRRVLVRKLVIGEAVGERPGHGLGIRVPARGGSAPGGPDAQDDDPEKE
jgi:hypothetical protein